MSLAAVIPCLLSLAFGASEGKAAPPDPLASLKEIQTELCDRTPELCLEGKVDEASSFFTRTLTTVTEDGTEVSVSVLSLAAAVQLVVAIAFMPLVSITGPLAVIVGLLFTGTGPLGLLPAVVIGALGLLWPLLLANFARELVDKHERKRALQKLASKARSTQSAPGRLLAGGRFGVVGHMVSVREPLRTVEKRRRQYLVKMAMADCPGDGALIHLRYDGKGLSPTGRLTPTAKCLIESSPVSASLGVWDIELEVTAMSDPPGPILEVTTQALPVDLRPKLSPWLKGPKAERHRATSPSPSVILSSSCAHRDLRPLSRPALRRLRNEVYARHGRKFQSPDLRQHFGAMRWYQPREAYRDADLSDDDRACVRRIRAWEMGQVGCNADLNLGPGEPKLVAFIQPKEEDREGLLVVGDVEVPWTFPETANWHAAPGRQKRPIPERSGCFEVGTTSLGEVVLTIQTGYGQGDDLRTVALGQVGKDIVLYRFPERSGPLDITESGDVRFRSAAQLHCTGSWVLEYRWKRGMLSLESADYFMGSMACAG